MLDPAGTGIRVFLSYPVSGGPGPIPSCALVSLSFSARRVFSGTRHRCPLSAEDVPSPSSSSSSDAKLPSTSSAITKRGLQHLHKGHKSRKKYAEGAASGRKKAEIQRAGMRRQMAETVQQNQFGIIKEHFSDIEDIELGELVGVLETGGSGKKAQRERDITTTMAQSQQRSALDSLSPKLVRGFRRRRPMIEPLPRRGLADVEEERRRTGFRLAELEGGLEVDDEEVEDDRTFSPRLDIDLTPQLKLVGRTSGRTSSARSSAALSQKAFPRDRRKSGDALNGSISSGVLVPAPPQITVTSPPDSAPLGRVLAEEQVEIGVERQQQRQQNETLNPALIKGISKSIWRFRGRNRINDTVAQEQANFMSRFGMSRAGIQLENTPVAATVGQRRTKSEGWEKFVFDANENYFYQWNALVSTAYVYNLLVVIARSVFVELAAGRLFLLWLALDLCMDSVYLVDMLVRSRTGYLEQGLLVRDSRKIRSLYVQSRQFVVDSASLLPLDFLVAFMWSHQPILRLNRLLRRERIQRFMEQTETRTAMPNAFRVGVVVWYIAVIIHWNACFYFMISEHIGLGSDPWVYGKNNKQSLPDGINDTLTRRYIYSFYWSTLILTTIGEVPGPQQNVEFAFVTVDLMCGVLIFATIVGNVGSMIANISADRTEFQNRIDSIKQYMDLRGVGKQLEVRVIKWFDYLWANKQGLTDAQVLKVLPDKLQAEIAMHVHFETLRKDCEAGLLAELVLKLQLQVFSPGDYVCRKGDIGREMYIVKRGMLQVVTDDGAKVFATLSEGAVFGELSILNIAGSKNGNRRTANVRSVGYTDLFVLNKSDLWIALREYPEARKILINKGRELLRKDNLLDENAPEEQKTAEEQVEELQGSVHVLQTRIARLVAEHTNTETKVRGRIAELERLLNTYQKLLEDNEKMKDDDGE
uniref:Cyclic nucleotide-binding domain-containing protein n=1 Tax=Globodera pallida TaxID=36090 RepID=A0A183BTQ4_GLOPA